MLRQGGHDARDICRLVPLPAVRHRRQKRAVGFGQQPIERHAPGRLAQRPGLGKRHDPGERDEEAERQPGVGERVVSRETVQDAAQLAAALLAQDRQRVLVGLAGVDDDRPLQLAREPDLRAEHRVLHVTRREVVVVVEADLADRARRRRRRDCSRTTVAARCRVVGELVRLVRVHADGNATSGPERATRSACAASFALPASSITSARSTPASLRAGDHRVEIGGERFVGEMAVAVDHSEAGVGDWGLGGSGWVTRSRSDAALEGGERGRQLGLQPRLGRLVGEGVLERVVDHPLQRPVVEAVLLDRLAELQRQASIARRRHRR